jgi:hypothetical protein
MTVRARVITAVAVLVLATAGVFGRALASSLAPKERFPVIGCDSQAQDFPNHYKWSYAPSFCETGGSLGELEGINHAHWHGWGHRTATATGDLINGEGLEYPAKITAYDLFRCHRCFGIPGYNPSWYRRLHVQAAAVEEEGTVRGPFNVIIKSDPEE